MPLAPRPFFAPQSPPPHSAPLLCATAQCIGIPLTGASLCPYCLALATEFDCREHLAGLDLSASAAASAGDVLPMVPPQSPPYADDGATDHLRRDGGRHPPDTPDDARPDGGPDDMAAASSGAGRLRVHRRAGAVPAGGAAAPPSLFSRQPGRIDVNAAEAEAAEVAALLNKDDARGWGIHPGVVAAVVCVALSFAMVPRMASATLAVGLAAGWYLFRDCPGGGPTNGGPTNGDTTNGDTTNDWGGAG